MAESTAPLYLRLAQKIEDQIRHGALRVGDRLPSIRVLRRQQAVSVSTVLQAYFWLENAGCIEARPQSGFYVRVPFSQMTEEPEYRPVEPEPRDIDIGSLLVDVMNSAHDPAAVTALGAATSAPALLPNRRLAQIVQAIVRQMPDHSSHYGVNGGCEDLRRQVARRSLDFAGAFSPRDVIITCGAMEALNLALRAVARPGDLIAVENPTYFGVLQVIESYGMRALEIPTHHSEGLCLDATERAMKRYRPRVLITMSNSHNPLGFVVPEWRKKALLDLSVKYGVPIIEDDIYGDLAWEGRPRTIKSYDRKGGVVLCSSFSKVLPPGFRVGWVHAGRFRDRVEKLKLITNIATASLPQLAVARFLESGGYDRYLRKLRATHATQVPMYAKAIAKYFPAGTRMTRPVGGYVLWVELPKRVNAVKLYRAARAEHITVSPGPIFSACGRFRHHIRLNCGHPLTDAADRALLTLGRLAQQQMGS